MNAELFIHGPRNAFYGASSEIAYSKLFDNSSIKDEIRFVVEVRMSSDGNRYAYYTYCRYSNVQDCGGRNGAYIGLSVRLDSYYANLRAIYTVLEAVFDKGVLGLLVDKTPTGFQYRVEAFEPVKQQILERIERLLGSYLSNLYNPSEFITIDASFKKGQDIIKGIDDNKYTEARLHDIKSSGKIIFASSVAIDSILDVQNRTEQQLSDFRNKQAQEINVLRSRYEKSNEEVQEQYDAISSKYEASKQKVSSLEESYKHAIEENKRLLFEIDQIKSKLDSISGYAKDIDQKKDEVRNLKKKIESLENENDRLKKSAACASSSHKVSKMNHSCGDEDFRENSRTVKESVDFKSLGEGLRKYSLAFFLVIALVPLYVAAVILLSRKGTDNENNVSETALEQIVETKEVITSLPNNVSKLLYPNIKSSDETIIDEGGLLGGSELSFSIKSCEVDYLWEIKKPSGELETQGGSRISFIADQQGSYIIKVFAGQSLVGIKTIDI